MERYVLCVESSAWSIEWTSSTSAPFVSFHRTGVHVELTIRKKARTVIRTGDLWGLPTSSKAHPPGQVRHKKPSSRSPGICLEGEMESISLTQTSLLFPTHQLSTLPILPCLHRCHYLPSTWTSFLASDLSSSGYLALDVCVQLGSSSYRSRPDLGEGLDKNKVRGLARLTRH